MFFCFHYCLCGFFFFFFSSRRRHTRLVSDWSSDVCSSDLCIEPLVANGRLEGIRLPELERRRRLHVEVAVAEDRRRIRGVGGGADLADHHRPLPVWNELRLTAAPPHLVRDPIRSLDDVAGVRRVCADGRYPQEVGELVQPLLGQLAHGGESTQT